MKNENTPPPAATGPEPWVRYDPQIVDYEWGGEPLLYPSGHYYLAAPVEQWAKEVKELMALIAVDDLGVGGIDDDDVYIRALFIKLNAARDEAQRLLANWPVKEG